MAEAGRCDPVRLGRRSEVRHAAARPKRPEQGLLRLRKHFDLYANLRPAIVYPELAHASTLKTEVVAGLDLLILRELTGDIYFGQPRGVRTTESGEREGFDTMRYTEREIRRIAHSGVSARRASARAGVCSVDKANVLETTQFWRDVVTEVHTRVRRRRAHATCTSTTRRCS